ncbi:tRNA lysidine(34) synthetase TilS [Pseudoxanthomonas suwonensis]|uniref:tRNA lysidine(34) synthetase TilS n=1 Tax=Pseudoxanthomonas suwonensis TaxID=314722 RepID=UPI000466BFA8|nr:tRNA lysidine(34) synthetase TilS [Pseudoxanthomonas suwonensis]
MAPRLPLPFDALPATGALVVGFSGGLDSSALLHALALEPAARARGLRAVHVHHGLHADAGQWAAHCQAQARAWDVPVQVIGVQVPRDAGLGLEGAAREARYTALLSTLEQGDVLATAHHLDDQAETFLLRALRASGPEGLGAMRPLRRRGHAWQWRPLLDLPRTALLDYAREHGLEWIEDPSNLHPDPDRNFLRLQLLPLLRQRWPHAAAALARSAELCAQADALLADADAQLLRQLTREDPRTLPVSPLETQPPERRARLLRRWVRELGLPPLPGHAVERIERELLAARADARPCFAWAGARIERWGDLLHADREREPLPSSWSVAWDGREPLHLPDGGLLQLHDGRGAPVPGFDAPLRVHARQGGERITLPGRPHSHALKHVLQERAVPPWRRRHLPLLSDAEGDVLAAGDAIQAGALAQWLDARDWRLAWQPPGSDTAR